MSSFNQTMYPKNHVVYELGKRPCVQAKGNVIVEKACSSEEEGNYDNGKGSYQDEKNSSYKDGKNSYQEENRSYQSKSSAKN